MLLTRAAMLRLVRKLGYGRNGYTADIVRPDVAKAISIYNV